MTDGMDVPAEIVRRENPLSAIAQAKAKDRAARGRASPGRAAGVREQGRQAPSPSARRARSRAAKDPEPPHPGPKDSDQVNLTDEESRIMPFSGGGFEQSYNAQAGVDTEPMMVVTPHTSQACNDKREVAPTLQQIAALPAGLGEVQSLIADNGFFNLAVMACADAGVEPLLALKRQSHHVPLLERFAPDAPVPQTATNALAQMAHRLGTQAGRALYGLRKQTVEPVFGARNGRVPDEHARAGQGTGRMEPGDDGLEHQAHARAARGMKGQQSAPRSCHRGVPRQPTAPP